MRQVSVSKTGTGASDLIVLDYIQTPFNVSLSTKVTGSATYTIQHTFDDIFASGYSAGSGTWYDSDDTNFVNATANQNSNYAFPVRATRVNITTGAGTVELTAIQGIQT